MSENVEFYDNGLLKSCLLKENSYILDIYCEDDTIIQFYDNGKIQSCTLKDCQIIQGIPCKNGTVVEFYYDGKLSRAILAEDKVLNGTQFYSGDTLLFRCDGELIGRVDNLDGGLVKGEKNIAQHYKGAYYAIEGYATHSETDEKMVIYSHLITGRVFVRPLTMFYGSVYVNNKRVQRFRELGIAEAKEVRQKLNKL